MNKDQFENLYCKKSKLSIEEYNKYFVTLPCHCDGVSCEGWAVVTNNPLSIKSHNDIYNNQLSNS